MNKPLDPHQMAMLKLAAENGNNADLIVLKEVDRVETKVDKIKIEVDATLENVRLRRGPKGDKGDSVKGDPGAPGKDSQVPGPPGKDSQIPGPPGKDSQVPGPPGKDSQIPGPPGPPGPTANLKPIEERLTKLEKEIITAQGQGKKVSFQTGARGMFIYIDGIKRGILSNVNFVSGSGMAISYTKVNGQSTITFTSSGGGSGGVSVETPPEPVFVDADNSANSTVIFTVSAEPLWMVADGIQYFAGAGYTYNSGTGKVTMDVAPSASIRAIIPA